MTFKRLSLLAISSLLLISVSCERERVFTSNIVQRTSNYFKDGKPEAIHKIIVDHLKTNKEIIYAQIKYPGNSTGHLFSIKTVGSQEHKRMILFKVVDNQKSDYAMDRNVELTAYNNGKEYTIDEVFLDFTNAGMKIMNEDFHIILETAK